MPEIDQVIFPKASTNTLHGRLCLWVSRVGTAYSSRGMSLFSCANCLAICLTNYFPSLYCVYWAS